MLWPGTGYDYGRSMLGLLFLWILFPTRTTYIGESLILFLPSTIQQSSTCSPKYYETPLPL